MQIFDWYKPESGYYMYIECADLTLYSICGRFLIASPEVMLPKVKRNQNL